MSLWRIGLRVCAVLALLGVVSIARYPAPALAGGGQPDVSLSLVPTTVTPHSGDTFTVNVHLNMVPNSHAIATLVLALTFDPNVLKTISMQPLNGLQELDSLTTPGFAGLAEDIGFCPVCAVTQSEDVAAITFQVVGANGTSSAISWQLCDPVNESSCGSGSSTGSSILSLSSWDQYNENILGSAVGAQICVQTATCTPPATLGVSPTMAGYNDPLTLTGANFAPNESVTLYVNGTSTSPVLTATTDSTGAFSGTLLAPQNPLGVNTLTAVGQVSGRVATSSFVLISTVTPTATPSATATPTNTDTPTNTPTATPTITPTNTPLPPTATSTPVASLSINPLSGVYRQTVVLTGTNFGPRELVNIAAGTSGTVIYSGTTSLTGSFTLVKTVLPGAYGPVTLTAIGQTSGRRASTLFFIRPETLPRTATAAPGGRVVLSGYGFAAHETVKAYWVPGGLPLGHAAANAFGTFAGGTALTFTAPLSPTGSYKVYAIGQTSKAVTYSTITLQPSSGSRYPTNTAHDISGLFSFGDITGVRPVHGRFVAAQDRRSSYDKSACRRAASRRAYPSGSLLK